MRELIQRTPRTTYRRCGPQTPDSQCPYLERVPAILDHDDIVLHHLKHDSNSGATRGAESVQTVLDWFFLRLAWSNLFGISDGKHVDI